MSSESFYLFKIQSRLSCNMVQYSLLASGTSFALMFYFFFKRRRDESLPLPPGPKKLPVIGNLLDMPKGFAWITYHKWCKGFGAGYLCNPALCDHTDLFVESDIIHLSAGGTSLVVLDTAEAATELLERRSSIYSDR